MPAKITIINKTRSRLPDRQAGLPRADFKKAARAAEKILGKKLGTIQLVFVPAAEIRKLNKKYRRQDKPTNILAFTAGRDILICPVVARQEARKYGLPAKLWFAKLFIHAILHLEGYNHNTSTNRRKMEGLENKIVSIL